MKPKTKTQQTKVLKDGRMSDAHYKGYSFKENKTAENNQESLIVIGDSPDLSSQLNPSGCGTKFFIGKCGDYITSGDYVNQIKTYCELCSAKRLATAKALCSEKKKTLEFLKDYSKHIAIIIKIKELESEIKQIENEVPEVKE